MYSETGYDAARKLYMEERERRNALVGKEKAFMEKIEAVDTGRYSMSYDETILIARLHDNNALNSSYDYFRAGFLKGQRYEKAKNKKRRR